MTGEIDGPYDNVWTALSDTNAEAAELTLRSTLVIALRSHLQGTRQPPESEAKRLGASRREITDVLDARITRLPLDRLVAMAIRSGLKLDIRLAEPLPEPAE
jgi:predicted XRE-type DNA-binding protein